MQIEEMLNTATMKIDLATQKETFLETQIQNWLEGTSPFDENELQSLVDSTVIQIRQLQEYAVFLINKLQSKYDAIGIQVEKMNEKDEHTINNIRFNLEFKNAQIELLRIRNDLLRKAGIQYIHSSIDHIMARNGEDNTLELQKKTIVGMVATRMISLAEAKILYQNISVLKENTFDAIER